MTGSRVTLVAGPPCAGKTTYVHRFMDPSDVVLDYDVIFASISGASLYDHPAAWRTVVAEAFKLELQNLKRLPPGRGAWIIRNAPRKQHRAIFRSIHSATSIVLAVPAATCLARLAASDRPGNVKVEQAAAIARWWSEYEPSVNDVVFTDA